MNIEFFSKDGLTKMVSDVGVLRPFTVRHELMAVGTPGPNIAATRYYVRVCSDNITSQQLYEELDKAVEVSKETYEAIMKAKRTWCEHQVASGKISPFAVSPGMVNQPKEVSKC